MKKIEDRVKIIEKAIVKKDKLEIIETNNKYQGKHRYVVKKNGNAIRLFNYLMEAQSLFNKLKNNNLSK